MRKMKFLDQSFEHAVEIAQHFMIPETKNSKPETIQNFSSRRVTIDLQGVLSAIQFNDEFCFKSGKIGDVTANRSLASKFVTVQASPSQPSPQETLCFGHVLPKLPRTMLSFVPPHPSPLPLGERGL